MSLEPLHYWDENIPCLAACPVNTNAGLYVAAIADGDDERAWMTARLPNPFASVCGRVCAAPCEDACRRGEIDRPIAIRALKRYLSERHGPESPDGDMAVVAPPAVERTEHIGIVGGGPAGLACAHDLRRLGYQVTVYEATDRLGGAMWLGIPEYRLDRSILAADVDAILDLGVEVQFDTQLGRDVELADLRARHDAVFLGIGATLGRGLDVEGGDADGVLRAIEFLINMNRGYEVEIGERVLVIGGGDVAMDAARTALRAGDYDAAREGDRDAIVDALDVARTAARSGASSVRIMALESRNELPAHEFEVEEAEVEGIEIVGRRGPRRVTVDEQGRATGVETVGVRRVFDDDGRFAPEFDEDDVQHLEADTIILAIGQAIDLDALGPDGPAVSDRRTIGIDWDTGETSLADVWSGGDAAKGPRTLIDAIADGRRAATSIHRSFGGDLDEKPPGKLVQLERFHRLDDGYDHQERVDVPMLATGRRTGLAEVELGFTEEQARCEANRCLRCFANITLDVQACVLCGLCSDVCPVDVISLEPAGALDVLPEGAVGTALLLDETACIRCGLCIERCPPKALSMSVWTGVGVPA